jgi:hypothetical protein
MPDVKTTEFSRTTILKGRLTAKAMINHGKSADAGFSKLNPISIKH